MHTTYFVQPIDCDSQPFGSQSRPWTEAKSPASLASRPATTIAAPKPAETGLTAREKELGQKFVAQFGDKGAVWFLEAGSLERAQEVYAEKLAEKANLERTLSPGMARVVKGMKFAKTGISGFRPVNLSAESAEDFQPEANLSAGLSKFAAGLKLPAAK
jgi:hypothetical protein